MRRLTPLLIILLLIAACLRVAFFFTVLYMIVMAGLLAFLWNKRTLEQLAARRNGDQRAFWGDTLEIELEVVNGSRLPLPWLEVHESLPAELVSPPFRGGLLSLAPRERQTLRYTLNCRKRGYYQVGPLTLRSGDLLGIGPDRTVEVEAMGLTIYPRVVNLKGGSLRSHSPRAALPERLPLFEDPARVTGVRDYRPGDSPRRIHWTASARLGRPVVKQFEPTIARETLICLDLDEAHYQQRARYSAVELALTAAASLATYIAQREKLPVGLTGELYDQAEQAQVRVSLPPRREQEHLMALLTALGRAGPAVDTNMPRLLRSAVNRLPWGATLIAISGQLTPQLLDALLASTRRGVAALLVLVEAEAQDPALLGRAALAGVAIRTIWNDHDLEAL